MPFWSCKENVNIKQLLKRRLVLSHLMMLRSEKGQGIAEYAIMLAVILVVLMSAVRLIGANASNIFSKVGSAIQ